MKKKNDNMSWREALKLNSRAYRFLFKRYPKWVLSGLVCMIWNTLTPYVGIYLSALLIDELGGAREMGRLKFFTLAILISAALFSLVSALLSRWKNIEQTGAYYRYQQIYMQKLLDMDFTDIDSTKTHDLLCKITQHGNSGGWGLSRVVGRYESLISSVLCILSGTALTVTLFTSKIPDGAGSYTVLNNPLFVLLIIAVMLAVTLISPILYNKSGSYWARNADDHTHSNRLFDHFSLLSYNKDIATDVRIYRQEKFAEKFFGDKSSTFQSKGIFARLARGPMGLYSAAGAAVSVIFTGVVYAFVCIKAWAGAFGIGAITQYVTAISSVSNGVSSLISTAGDMKNNAPFLALVFEFLDIPNTMYQGSLTVEKRRDRDYEVEFRNVSFKYPGSESFALKNVSMKFKIGSRLAVVGMNGSGKTTFIKLLCRLYDPTEGEILLNGIDIRKYNYLDYMMIFSVVFQDFKLFSFGLGENVASGTDCDREKAADCLYKAGFGERLEELRDGLDTYLYKDYDKNGVNISGGEAQKIAIARALYKDAPFIILDEPTAALDPLAEAEIYSKFNEIAGDKTAIYISHRLSSCKFCDEIVVFHEGSIVQHGRHAELLSDENGKYYELWQAQAQYYVEKTEK